jgi:TolB protein
LVNGNDGRIRVVQTTDGTEKMLEFSLSGMLDAVISPNGDQVVFSLSTAGSKDLNHMWTSNLDGTGLRKHTKLSTMQHEPAWSWNGDLIYFLSGDGGQAHDIWQLAPESGKVQQLTVASLYHFDVAAGPDGRLAYSSNRSGNYEIWVGPPNQDKPPQQLTNHPALDAKPTWSPSGNTIAFESSRNGGLNIWKLDLESSELTQLTRHPKGARQPTWSRAGNQEASQ